MDIEGIFRCTCDNPPHTHNLHSPSPHSESSIDHPEPVNIWNHRTWCQVGIAGNTHWSRCRLVCIHIALHSTHHSNHILEPMAHNSFSLHPKHSQSNTQSNRCIFDHSTLGEVHTKHTPLELTRRNHHCIHISFHRRNYYIYSQEAELRPWCKLHPYLDNPPHRHISPHSNRSSIHIHRFWCINLWWFSSLIYRRTSSHFHHRLRTIGRWVAAWLYTFLIDLSPFLPCSDICTHRIFILLGTWCRIHSHRNESPQNTCIFPYLWSCFRGSQGASHSSLFWDQGWSFGSRCNTR